MTTDEAAAQEVQPRRPAHLQLDDPEARLAAFERQFGEYGGVNASIEVSTTFTGARPAVKSGVWRGPGWPVRMAALPVLLARTAVPYLLAGWLPDRLLVLFCVQCWRRTRCPKYSAGRRDQMQRMAAATCELRQRQAAAYAAAPVCLAAAQLQSPTFLLPGASRLLVYYFPPCSYGRSFNPTVRYLGRQLAALEGGEAAYCCASGKAPAACRLPRCCLWLGSLTGSCDLQRFVQPGFPVSTLLPQANHHALHYRPPAMQA